MPTVDRDNPKHQPVAIGAHRIAPGARTFVVAEAGVNHDGELDKALRLVDVAAACGADAVKFQVFRAVDLVSAAAPTAAYQRQTCGMRSQRDMLDALVLSDADFASVKSRCDQRGLLFMATPFSVADVARLVKLRVAAIKIASTDLVNVALLDAAVETGLSLILSTGASTAEEIDTGVRRLLARGVGDRLILLHCVSRYPTPLDTINLGAIASLRNTYALPIGLSDHTVSTQTGGWAVAAGACVLEKHFTLDRSALGPDHAMSLSPEALTTYIAAVREVEAAMGTGRIGMTDAENEVRRVAGRSIVAAADIPAGAVLTMDGLTSKRPGTGIAPDHLDQLLGKRATVAIPFDTLVSWDMVG